GTQRRCPGGSLTINHYVFVVFTVNHYSLLCYGASLKSRHYAWKRQEQKDLKVLFELSLDPRSKSKGGFKNGYRQVLESVLGKRLPNSCLTAVLHIES
ncbi:Os08g0305000, partial [Oryza sativa Japonica Group]